MAQSEQSGEHTLLPGKVGRAAKKSGLAIKRWNKRAILGASGRKKQKPPEYRGNWGSTDEGGKIA